MRISQQTLSAARNCFDHRLFEKTAGSASSFVAALEMGFDYVGFEINPDYYKKANQWVESTKSQGKLFKAQVVFLI